MNSFEYYNPVKVIFGENSISQVGREAVPLGGRALIVSYKDPIYLTEAIHTAASELNAHGITCFDCFNVLANPLLSQAREGISICRREGVDLIIGIGGGSVMDCAKVIAAGVNYEYDIANMIMFSHSNITRIPPKNALPTIMIPTLPATGSEMNPTAVITDEVTHKKSYIWEPDLLFPKVAILDPCLTVGLPSFQSACGAIDIIAHVTEAYLNGESGVNLDLQDGMQEGVISAVLKNLPRVMENPGDLQARGVIMWSASIALNGWLTSGTFSFTPMHQMGHVLSAHYNATHGATLACMMLAWMKYFQNRTDNSRYVKFSKNIFGGDIAGAVRDFERYMIKYSIPTRISHFGAKAEDIPGLTEDVVSVSFAADNMLSGNPKMTKEDIQNIFEIALI